MNRLDLDEAECRAVEVAVFTSEFLRYAAMDDLSQPCPIGTLVSDYRMGDSTAKRRQTIAEVIAEELDSGDNMARAVTILCKLAQGFCPVGDAHKLLQDLAASWADKRSDL